MFPSPDSEDAGEDGILAERVDSLVSWIQELDGRLKAAEAATGDPKSAKELRKAIEALAKHDPKLEERLTNQVAVMKDRLAMLAETVSSTSAGLAARDGEIAALRRELEAERAQVQALAVETRSGPGGPAPREIEQLRRAIADLSDKRGRGKRDASDGVPDKLEIFEQRLDTLAKTVATASASLASKDGELAALKRQLEEDIAGLTAALADVRAAVDPALVAELRLNLKELAGQTAELARGSKQGTAELRASLETLATRLSPIEQSVAATTQGVAAREQELAALRASVDEETGRLDSHVAAIEQALAQFAPQLAALGEVADRESVNALEEQHRWLADRLEALGREVQETGRGYADTEAALSRRFDEGRAQVEQLIAEVRADVHALSEQGATEELEGRLQDVSGRVEDLAGRLAGVDEMRAEARAEVAGARAELAGALEAVSARIEALSSAVERGDEAESERERRLAALSQRFDEGRRQVQALMAEVRAEVEALAGQEVTDDLDARLQEVSRRLEGLARGLDGVDELRADVARARADVTGAVGDVSARLETLGQEHAESTQALAHALEASRGDREALAGSTRLLEERVHGVSESLGSLAQRLADLSSAVERDDAAESERERQLAALSQRFEDDRTRVEELVAEVRSDVQRLAGQGASEALEDGLREVGRRVEELAGRLGALDEVSAGTRAELVGALDDVAARMETLEREQLRSAEELARTLEAARGEREAVAGSTRLLEERVHGVSESLDSLARRLDALSSAVERGGEAESERERQLAALSGRFDEGRAQVEALVGDLRHALETMPEPGPDLELLDQVDSLETRVEAIAATLRSSASQEDTERLLGKLLLRLDAVEHAQQTLADDVAARATETISGRLEELDARLEQLEVAGRAAAVGADSRTRQELRQLELRMEHTEDAARENREAVLTQLERLASRMEWRLLRLEEATGTTDVGPRSLSDGAQVVPIRGSEV